MIKSGQIKNVSSRDPLAISPSTFGELVIDRLCDDFRQKKDSDLVPATKALVSALEEHANSEKVAPFFVLYALTLAHARIEEIVSGRSNFGLSTGLPAVDPADIYWKPAYKAVKLQLQQG